MLDSNSVKPFFSGEILNYAEANTITGSIEQPTYFNRVLNIEYYPEFRCTIYKYAENTILEYSKNSKIKSDVINSKFLLTNSILELTEKFRLKNCKVISELNIDEFIKQSAPTIFTYLGMLKSIASARFSYTKLSANLFSCYAEVLANGNTRSSVVGKYKKLLEQHGICFADADSNRFIEDDSLLIESFELPNFYLSVGSFPGVYFPEVVATAIFYVLFEVFPFIAHGDELQSKLFNCLNLVEKYKPKQVNLQDFYLRVLKCISYCMDQVESWLDAINKHTMDNSEIHHSICEIFETKAKYAKGFHKCAKVDGKPLESWFSSENFDSHSLIQALANSHYIVPGKPGKSIFLTKLVTFGGPMFRIFTAEEIEIVSTWIKTLKLDKNGDYSSPKKHYKKNIKAIPFYYSDINPIQRSYRKLFHDLLYFDEHPDLIKIAKKIVSLWLEMALQSELYLSKNPCEIYEFTKLQAWLEQQHACQIENYQPMNQKIPNISRDQLIEQTIQYVPFAFVDGAWLQGITSPKMHYRAMAGLLFNTFADEIGNGNSEWNHPNIYNKLVLQMGVNLPDFNSPEFSASDKFKDWAFLIPIFWLSISQFSGEFFPEVLGLNLAMELSGVGAEYMSVADALRYYGFDPYFIQLHNIIDNAATGHTAWALQAIRLYMEQLTPLVDSESLNKHWWRIWQGYSSLKPPKGIGDRLKQLCFLST